MDKTLNSISTMLLFLETRFGKYLASLVVGFFLLCIAAIYVTPALTPMQLGRGYAALSNNPFDFSDENYLRYRILTPFLAYCVGLRGPLYIIFPMIITLFFITAVYHQLRKKEDITESVLITMLICFSSPVLFLLHYQGYTDITSYLLIFFILIFIKRPLICLLLLALLVLNHASNLFAIPFLFIYFFINSENKYKSIAQSTIGIVLALIPFFCYRNYIAEFSGIEYDFAMYRSQIIENVKTVASHFYTGFFYAFKLFWLVPAVAICYYWKEKNFEKLILLVSIVVCAMSQVLLGSDTSRFIGSAFPAILFGAIKLKEVWGTKLFIKRIGYLVLFNFFVPQYYVGQGVMVRFYPLPSSLILKYIFGIETWIG